MKTPTFLSLASSLTLALMLTIGCEVPEIDVSESSATVAKQQPAEKPAAKGVKEGYLPDGRLDMSGVAGEPPMTTSTPREVHFKDPKHGKLSRRDGGALGSVVEKIPSVEHKTVFMMIAYNLNIFDADKGHFPKSHEEFMEVYLPQYYPAALPLPELESGDEYIYDPDDHLLKIYRPEG